METDIQLQTAAMERSRLLTDGSMNLDLVNLPVRLDDQMLAAVEKLANLPLPALQPCDDRHFAQCIRIMLATLSKRNSDDLSGDLLLAAYRRILGHHPREAIDYLCLEVLARCKWFPSIAECSEILAGWKRKDNRPIAAARARHERQARLEEAMVALERGELTGEQIGAMPERFLQIALTRGLVWFDPDGTYRPRPLRRPELLDAPAGTNVFLDDLAEKWPSQRGAA